MTEDNATTPANGNGTADDQPQIQVLGQYIKDLSFENPNAPMSLQGPGENPKMNVEVNVTAKKVGDDAYESAINFNAKATNDAGTVYEMEVVYAGLVQLKNVPDNVLQPALLINCPTLIFPFLRRLVADTTREGGFPPLLLEPIDFNALYAQNAKKAREEAQKHAAAEAPSSVEE